MAKMTFGDANTVRLWQHEINAIRLFSGNAEATRSASPGMSGGMGAGLPSRTPARLAPDDCSVARYPG
jgi:hypothetical protein